MMGGLRQFMTRLGDVMHDAPSWGRMLASLGAAWLAAGQIIMPETQASTLPAYFGSAACSAWLTCMAVLPVIAVGLHSDALRLIGSTMHTFTWMLMWFIATWEHGPLAPEIGAYLTWLVANVVSEYRTLRRMEMERRWAGTI
jgi:hypothetical protein